MIQTTYKSLEGKVPELESTLIQVGKYRTIGDVYHTPLPGRPDRKTYVFNVTEPRFAGYPAVLNNLAYCLHGHDWGNCCTPTPVPEPKKLVPPPEDQEAAPIVPEALEQPILTQYVGSADYKQYQHTHQFHRIKELLGKMPEIKDYMDYNVVTPFLPKRIATKLGKGKIQPTDLVAPRPQNAFIIFSKMYSRVLARHQIKMRAADRQQEISKEWGLTDQKIKHYFTQLGLLACQVHQFYYPDYKFTPKKLPRPPAISPSRVEDLRVTSDDSLPPLELYEIPGPLSNNSPDHERGSLYATLVEHHRNLVHKHPGPIFARIALLPQPPVRLVHNYGHYYEEYLRFLLTISNHLSYK